MRERVLGRGTMVGVAFEGRDGGFGVQILALVTAKKKYLNPNGRNQPRNQGPSGRVHPSSLPVEITRRVHPRIP